MFSKEALCSKCQIDGEDFVKFCGLLRKHDETNILDIIFVQDSEVSVVSNPKISFSFGKFHIVHES